MRNPLSFWQIYPVMPQAVSVLMPRIGGGRREIIRLPSILHDEPNNRLILDFGAVNPLRAANLAVKDLGAELPGGGGKLQITARGSAA
ncbi:Uncharacterised protein [Serratia plymuthica]|nr:Uncharacterised protein [Serratia plymuthica]